MATETVLNAEDAEWLSLWKRNWKLLVKGIAEMKNLDKVIKERDRVNVKAFVKDKLHQTS